MRRKHLSLLFATLLLATAARAADETPRTVPDASVPPEKTTTEDDAKVAPQPTKDADESATPQATEGGAKHISGMSVLGNQEAPTSLVIVPWKSSEIGAALGISTMLDDSRQPVDREVFLRELSYYRIRSGTTP